MTDENYQAVLRVLFRAVEHKELMKLSVISLAGGRKVRGTLRIDDHAHLFYHDSLNRFVKKLFYCHPEREETVE